MIPQPLSPSAHGLSATKLTHLDLNDAISGIDTVKAETEADETVA
jgi:hypothetical protein